VVNATGLGKDAPGSDHGRRAFSAGHGMDFTIERLVFPTAQSRGMHPAGGGHELLHLRMALVIGGFYRDIPFMGLAFDT
jgi:hypothetical protein